MKKFLAVFDGFKMAPSTLDYAIHLTKLANAHLVGVFPDEFVYRNYDLKGVIRNEPDYARAIQLLDEKDNQKRSQSVEIFQEKCMEANISFDIRREKSIAQQDLRHESLFADLIIINQSETFTGIPEDLPTHFIRGLLEDAHCPVIVVPEHFRSIENIALLYDGSPASVIAIKMFSYLFGESLKLPMQVFTFNAKKSEIELPDRALVYELINRHFHNAEFKISRGASEDHILNHIKQFKGTWLIVLGAYSRNQVSRWLHSSLADGIIREIPSPLFSAHGK